MQILDIIDVTESLNETLTHIEMVSRKEMKRGKEIIRVVPSEDGGDVATAASRGGRGTYKLHLEDASGRRVWAFELSPIEGVKISMNIGAKLVLTSCVVARGVILLEPKTCTVLGGKVDELMKAWTKGREETAKKAILELKSGN